MDFGTVDRVGNKWKQQQSEPACLPLQCLQTLGLQNRGTGAVCWRLLTCTAHARVVVVEVLPEPLTVIQLASLGADGVTF